MLAFADHLAIAAAAFGVATCVVPWARYALQSRKPPKTSLASVGRAIGFLILAACLSGAGLLLALPALAFAPHPGWAWLGVSAIAGFWLCICVFGYLTSRRSRQRNGC